MKYNTVITDVTEARNPYTKQGYREKHPGEHDIELDLEGQEYPVKERPL